MWAQTLGAFKVYDIAILCNVEANETLRILDGIGRNGLLTTERQNKYNIWTQFGRETRQILNNYYNHQFCMA
jgi:hypothetical protein